MWIPLGKILASVCFWLITMSSICCLNQVVIEQIEVDKINADRA